MDKRANGFTIVELLIVIVVIAILAVITIVAFNGISDRTNATQANSAMASNIKALVLYATEIGSYPTPTSPNTQTIGCFDGTANCNGSAYQATSTALVNAVLKETTKATSGSLPSFWNSRYALIQYSTGSPTPPSGYSNYYVQYIIPASQNCPAQLAGASLGSTVPSGTSIKCNLFLPIVQ